MTIQIAPKTKIICNGTEFFCNIIGEDERGYTVIDWLLDMVRSVLPPSSSGIINCNEATKQQIFKAYADWNLYTKQEDEIRDMRIATYQKYDSILLNGVRVRFVDIDTDDIVITETERNEHENMLTDFWVVNSL